MTWRGYYAISLATLAVCVSAAAQSAVPNLPPPGQVPRPAQKRAPVVITDKQIRAGNLGVGITSQERIRNRAERTQQLQNQNAQRRVNLSPRLRGMGVYKPKDGGAAMLTNRINEYNARGDYKREIINYDPIVIPDRWGKTVGKYTDTDVHKYVSHYAKLYGLDESLIHAVIHVESRGNPYAVSPKGAAGLMQLMPGTARDLKVNSVFDPAENIAGGSQYLSKLMKIFNGDATLALAGYNSGPETVKRYGGIPPYRETQNYVRDVVAYWNHYKVNGNSKPYVKFDENQTPTAKAERAKERLETKVAGDPSRTSHDVVFASGNTQVAQSVSHHGDYVYLVADGRTFRVKRSMVQSVDGTPLTPEDAEMASVPDATVPLPKDKDVQLAAQI